jgi:hypothetical protein
MGTSGVTGIAGLSVYSSPVLDENIEIDGDDPVFATKTHVVSARAGRLSSSRGTAQIRARRQRRETRETIANTSP